jgi:hypothetical protein
MLMVNNLIGFGAGQTTILGSSSYIGTAASASPASNVVTFSAQAIGAADPTRRVVVTVTNFSGTIGLSSATIGGIAATIHISQGDGFIESSAIISALVPTGTTADIVLTFSGTPYDVTANVYRQINETVSSPYATAFDLISDINGILTTTIDIPANGMLYAVAAVYTGTTSSYTWVGAIERNDINGGSGFTNASSASETGLGGQTGRTVTATCTQSGDGTLVAMSWR